VSFAAVLLAASDAMIDGVPLPLLPFGEDATLVEHQARALIAAGATAVEVVVGAHANAIIPLVATGDIEPVPAPAGSDAAALRAGLSALVRGAAAALVTRIAEPRSAAMFAALAEAHAAAGAPITRPVIAGRPGMPVVLGAEAIAWARNVSDEGGGLEGIIARFPVRALAVEGDAWTLRVTSRAACDRARAVLGD